MRSAAALDRQSHLSLRCLLRAVLFTTCLPHQRALSGAKHGSMPVGGRVVSSARKWFSSRAKGYFEGIRNAKESHGRECTCVQNASRALFSRANPPWQREYVSLFPHERSGRRDVRRAPTFRNRFGNEKFYVEQLLISRTHNAARGSALALILDRIPLRMCNVAIPGRLNV